MLEDIAAVGPGPVTQTPNYTKTKDPNVVMGKYGTPITFDEFTNANKNGYAWKDFNSYADYVGGWARPIPKQNNPPPYYRANDGTPNIPTYDVEILRNKYNDQPQIQQALNRNIAKPGEIPQFGASDADLIRALIAKEKYAANTYVPKASLATNLKKDE